MEDVFMSTFKLNNYLSNSKSFFDLKLKQRFPELKENFSGENPPVIYGAGIVGQTLYKKLSKHEGIPIKIIADANKKFWGTKIGRATIISPEKLVREYSNRDIIVASIIYEKEIYDELRRKGLKKVYPFSYLNYLKSDIYDYRDYHSMYLSLFAPHVRKKISQIYNLLSDEESKRIFSEIINLRLSHYFNVDKSSITSFYDQYFDPEIVKLNKDEIFVDGGAYDGDTVKKLYKNKKINNFERIYSFEPDKRNINKLKIFIKKFNIKNTTTEEKGLFVRPGFVNFFSLGSPESGIGSEISFSSWSGKIGKSSGGSISKIPVTSIDSYFQNKNKPTFIKMDIEGAEIEALNGAKKTITAYKPKLAICVYHKPSDLWEIPLLIYKMRKDYSFYIRHYSKEVCETVFYAI